MNLRAIILPALVLTAFAAHAHDDADPGTEKGIVPGTFGFACLEAGHFEAGMLGKVSVK